MLDVRLIRKDSALSVYAVGAALALAACTAEVGSEAGDASGAPGATPDAAWRNSGTTSDALARLDGLRGVARADLQTWLQEQSGPGFAFRGDGSTEPAVARNPERGFEVLVRGDHVMVQSESTGGPPSWLLGFRLAGMGREDGAPRMLRERARSVDGNQVRIDRGDLVEWYLNGALGLQQGFDLLERPAGRGAVQIHLGLDGNLEAVRRGDEILFVSSSGKSVVAYRDLVVQDAEGRELPSWMELGGGALILAFADDAATYPVRVDPIASTEESLLQAPLPVAGDQYGIKVDISGETAVVGARYRDTDGADAGTAFVYVRSGGVWTQQQRLSPKDAEAGDLIGWDVAIDGDTIVIGAANDDDDATNAGAAYVFTRSGTRWTERAKLTGSRAAMNDSFGHALDIDDGRIVVSAYRNDDEADNAGLVYVFEGGGASWTEEAVLTASDAFADAFFGSRVAVDGGTIVVTALNGGAPLNRTGAAYVFLGSGSSWTQSQKLVPSGLADRDRFGRSVDLDGNVLVISAHRHDDGGTDAGAAWIYERTTGPFSVSLKVLPTDPESEDYIGGDVAVAGRTVLIGAEGRTLLDSDGETTLGNAGVVYVYSKVAGDGWSEQAVISADVPQRSAWFGSAVGISDEFAVVGAYGYDDEGAAYMLRLGSTDADGTACEADLDCASGHCVDGVCCENACGGDVATDCLECNASGVCTTITTGDCGGVPGPPTVLTPTGSVFTATPTVSWAPADRATSYRIKIDDADAVGKVDATITATAAGCEDGVSTCSYDYATRLGLGSAIAWVRGINDSGNGPWRGSSFSVDGEPVPTVPPVLVAPSGTTSDTSPDYVWEPVDTAVSYDFELRNGLGALLESVSLTSAELGCGDGVSDCTYTSTITLLAGTNRFFVRGANLGGGGPWANRTFTVDGTPLPTDPPNVTAPTGSTTDTTPDFEWDADPVATSYDIEVVDSRGLVVVNVNVGEVAAGCDSDTTCVYTSPVTLLPGSTTFWIRSRNATGAGRWGNTTFTIDGTPPPSTPSPIAPSGTIMTSTPTYQWGESTNADIYRLRVNDSEKTGRVNATYTPADAGCDGAPMTCEVTPAATVATGDAIWWIRAENATGNSTWTFLRFTAP